MKGKVAPKKGANKTNTLIINNKSLEKNYLTPFCFESKTLREWCEFVKSYNPSNYRQIEIQAVQCFSAIIAYCNQPNLPFFLLDISDSGTGKSRNKKFQFDILFKLFSALDTLLFVLYKIIPVKNKNITITDTAV
ncbi:hypothetical protein [uncultured Campylobacter sp.]|uniref:hypothetical protein n=1 Tax=uncultured Campylobacter sp. TaxID=218934 RepID=UPI00262072F4|nr:hypothetical protein [uncultured Campylobacter sp.]